MSDPRGRRRRLADARLYVVSPARMRAGRLADLIPALARAGVDLVQLRDRSLTDAQLDAEAAACAAAAASCGVLFIVNDLPELARAVGADGVHLGQGDGVIADARALLGPDRLIGRSTRGGDQLDAAADEGADYASVGPLWETPTKPGRAATELARAAAAARAARIPWFAIGGIDERRVLRAAAVGARRVVVVRAVVEAEDPEGAARRLRARLVDAAPRVLSVAGSDSSGGAGIQADIKAIVRAGGFPTCAITALTAQTTVGVRALEVTSPQMVADQIACAAEDIGVDAVKTGMLATRRSSRRSPEPCARRRSTARRSSSTPFCGPSRGPAFSPTAARTPTGARCCQSRASSPRTCSRRRRSRATTAMTRPGSHACCTSATVAP